MKRYETILHIITEGRNRSEAEEKAGSLIQSIGEAKQIWLGGERRATPRPKIQY